MHEYYKKNENKLKKDLDVYLKSISDELTADTKQPYPELFNEIWTLYRNDLMEKFPYIGGDKASGTKNLTGAYGFIAMGEICCKKYNMDLERWGYLTTLCYQRFFDRFPSFLKKLVGYLMTKPALINKLLKKKDAKNAANARLYPGSFETKTQEPTKEYPANYHTLVCPLADFAKEYGYMEYMPYICNLDYVMFQELNIPFYRECTCAAGDGFCDFKLKLGAPINAAWPCHSANENDPLK